MAPLGGQLDPLLNGLSIKMEHACFQGLLPPHKKTLVYVQN